MGDVTVELYSKDAPKTVANFVGLASGEKPWTDALSRQRQTRPLYNDTIFHRVIPGFMIQGGDPLGNGTGDPGYKFEDEFQGGHAFDHPGILAMANAGPVTNGSQFFITVAPTQHLTGTTPSSATWSGATTWWSGSPTRRATRATGRWRRYAS